MVDTGQFLLAALTGCGFAYVIYRMGSSPLRLLTILFALWTLQTGSQYIYRWLDGADVAQEVVVVTSLRLTFTGFAVLTVWLFDKKRGVT